MITIFLIVTLLSISLSRYAVRPLAGNVSGAWRRAGFRKGLDGRRTPKVLRSVPRDNAPPDAKPLVTCWRFFHYSLL